MCLEGVREKQAGAIKSDEDLLTVKKMRRRKQKEKEIANKRTNNVYSTLFLLTSSPFLMHRFEFFPLS